MFRIVYLTTILAAASARYNVQFRQEEKPPTELWDIVTEPTEAQNQMMHHVIDLMMKGKMVTCENNEYYMHTMEKKQEARRQGQPAEGYKFTIAWKDKCHETKRSTTCNFRVDKVGNVFDIVNFNCEKLHWTVDHGNPTEVPPPTSEIPVTEPEVTTEEVENTSVWTVPPFEPVSIDLVTEEPESTYETMSPWVEETTPATRPWSRGFLSGTRHQPHGGNGGGRGGHQIFVMGDEKN